MTVRLLLLYPLLRITEKEKQLVVLIKTKTECEAHFSVHPYFCYCYWPAQALNIKDEDLVYSLQSYFGVGKIKQDISHNDIVFYVNSVAELTSVIIPFFDNYPLITQKISDFLLFKKAVNLLK